MLIQKYSKRMIDLKLLLYQCFYMDNGAVSAENCDALEWAFSQLKSIFNPYKFDLQQFMTNDHKLQAELDEQSSECPTPDKVKLLGTIWDRQNDTLSTGKIELNSAAKTKRTILQTIASQYDIFNINGPLMNRARIFMHSLQCNKALDWDDPLDDELLREWRNIARQANSAPVLEIERNVGSRTEEYELIAYTDASTQMYGVVIYLHNKTSNKITFVFAKNRIVNQQLNTKSVPALELQAILLGVQNLIELYSDLCGSTCLVPINVSALKLYSDSLVALSWLNSYSRSLDKMQKKPIFVLNRLEQISKLCSKHPVNFAFISGTENPGDCITRPMSHKQLICTNYITDPNLNSVSLEQSCNDLLTITIPNPQMTQSEIAPHTLVAATHLAMDFPEQLIPIDRFSSFKRLISVYGRVLNFVHKLKCRMKKKHPEKYSHLLTSDFNYRDTARLKIIRIEQQREFSDIFDYFNAKEKSLKCIPNLVTQLNVYLDTQGLLRVKSKFNRPMYPRVNFPILLPKNSMLTHLMIRELHCMLNHSGCYQILSELRKNSGYPIALLS